MEPKPFDVSSLRVASPCKMPWSQMQGDAKVRFCGACRLNVYNVEAMTRAELAELTGNGEESVCMRLYRRADGTVLTADCPVGKRVRDRIVLAASTVAAAVLAIVSAAVAYPAELRALVFGASCDDTEHPSVVPTQPKKRSGQGRMMGKVMGNFGSPGKSPQN